MAQIGWNGESKPREMCEEYTRRFAQAPVVPQKAEGSEVHEAPTLGFDLHSGVKEVEAGGEYDVDGVLLGRPFKVVHVRPVRLFVRNLEQAETFYQRVLGLTKTEEIHFEGQRCVFLRASTEHHSLALYPIGLREALDLRRDTTAMALGLQVGNYGQLRRAVSFLKERGCTVRELPPELFPGMGRSAFVFDPDGHAVQLYSYMETIGWDGKPRPAHLRTKITPGDWPNSLPPEADEFGGEIFAGPVG
jgi:catechol 2,3-dioxygenase-like lactoylglutathione lyase family enzyme